MTDEAASLELNEFEPSTAMVDQGGELVADVFVEKMTCAQPNGEKQHCLHELIGRNEHEPFVMAAFHEEMEWGADHDPCGEVKVLRLFF